MRTGAIVLCGGESTRMGRDKATLPFGGEAMLQRVVRLLCEAVDARNIVVVAAPDQPLPPLPVEVTAARDAHPGRGPLEGIAAGLRAFTDDIEAVFVTSCDAPLLVPAFVTRMFELLGDCDIAVPRDGGQVHPLSAVCRRTILPLVEQFLSTDRLSVRAMFDEARTQFIDVGELRAVDPDLQTLMNLNHPENYRAALRTAGLAVPEP